MPAVSYLTTDKTATVEGTQGENGWYKSDIIIKAPDGFLISAEGKPDSTDWESSLTITEEGSRELHFSLKNTAGYITAAETFTAKKDTEAPEVEITVDTNKGKSFLNTITFGCFFKETQSVTITATDKISGVADIQYLVYDKQSDAEFVLAQGVDGGKSALEDLAKKNGGWKDGESFVIAPDHNYIVFAKVTDEAGYVTYVSSDGLVLDATKPEVKLTPEGTLYTGASAGENVYDGGATVTVEYSDVEKDGVASDIEKVTYKLDNGAETNIPDDNKITITDKGVHTVSVTATDKAGNSTTESVKVTVFADAPTITFEQIGNVIYDGKVVEAGTDFALERGEHRGAVTYSYVMTKDSAGTAVTSGAAVTGLPKEAGTYTVKAEIAEDAKKYYKAAEPQMTLIIEKAGFTPQEYRKSYPAARAFTGEKIDLKKLVPAGCGIQILSYDVMNGNAGVYQVVIADTGEMLFLDMNAMTGEDFTAEKVTKTITVKLSDPNYEISDLKITIVRTECEHSGKVTTETTKEPTCTVCGYQNKACDTCKEVIESGIYVAPLGHDYKATFTWNGYESATATIRCERNGCNAGASGLEATVTESETSSAYIYTAKVIYDSVIFTDTRSVSKPGSSSGGGGYSGGGGGSPIPTPEEQKPSDIKPEQPEKTEKPDTLSSINKLITENKLDKIKTVSYLVLQPQATGSKKAVTVTWKKVKDADGYVIYGAESTKTLKKLKTVKAQETSYSNKNLKTGKAYQYIVVAYKTVDGKKYVISVSEEIYACTNGKTYANPTGIKIASTKVTLQKGRTKTLKPSLVLPKGKKYKAHTDKFRYESSNSSVATVTKKGVVKAKKKGTAYIYIYTTNGVCKNVKVTVK